MYLFTLLLLAQSWTALFRAFSSHRQPSAILLLLLVQLLLLLLFWQNECKQCKPCMHGEYVPD